MDARERLRKHVRTLLERAGLNVSAQLNLTLEDEFIQLFNDYARASNGSKESVYEAGERRILDLINDELSGKSLRANHENPVLKN